MDPREQKIITQNNPTSYSINMNSRHHPCMPSIHMKINNSYNVSQISDNTKEHANNIDSPAYYKDNTPLLFLLLIFIAFLL